MDIDWDAETEAADLELSDLSVLVYALKAVARAARDVAMFPVGNATNPTVYHRRKDAIERLRSELSALPPGTLDE